MSISAIAEHSEVIKSHSIHAKNPFTGLNPQENNYTRYIHRYADPSCKR